MIGRRIITTRISHKGCLTNIGMLKMTERKDPVRLARPMVILCALAALSACSSDNLDDLRQYVEQVQAKKGGRIDPVPEFRPFETVAYEVSSERDPFSPWVINKPSPATAIASNTELQPDATRRKEALEEFPLDSLKMTGILEAGDQRWAIISAPDGVIYRVTKGNHIGQNNGKITEVTDLRVAVREIVPDGLGGWRVRESTVALIE